MGHNNIQYVLFEPQYVGWTKGLEGAIKDAESMGVPLAVNSEHDLAKVRLMHQNVNVILLEQ